ncbi:LamG domain-containing protein [Planctomycetota bacterium]
MRTEDTMIRAFVVALMLVGAMAVGLTARAVPMMPGPPTAGWLLDEGTGTTTYELGGVKTGTLNQNAAFSTDTPFAYAGNHSLSLTGTTGDRALLAGTPSGTAGTFQLWVKTNDTAAPQYLIDGTNGHRTLIYRNSATSYSMYINQTSIGGFPASHTPEGDWTHLAVVWDNSLATGKQQLYVDGVPTNAYNKTLSAKNPAQVWLGNRFSNNEALNGKLDEYALWSTPLGPDEIEWLASNSVHSIPEPCTLALLGMGALALLRRRRR